MVSRPFGQGQGNKISTVQVCAHHGTYVGGKEGSIFCYQSWMEEASYASPSFKSSKVVQKVSVSFIEFQNCMPPLSHGD